MNNNGCPDYHILLDAEYQSGARMNIAVDKIIKTYYMLLKISQQRMIAGSWL